ADRGQCRRAAVVRGPPRRRRGLRDRVAGGGTPGRLSRGSAVDRCLAYVRGTLCGRVAVAVQSPGAAVISVACSRTLALLAPTGRVPEQPRPRDGRGQGGR